MKHLLIPAVLLILIPFDASAQRHKMTPNGPVPFTAQEEKERDAAEAASLEREKTKRLSPNEKMIRFLAEKFGMTADQVKAAIDAQQ